MLSLLSGTGEHGVGLGKKEFLVHELGVGTVQLMRTIKQAMDPHDLFNPGKVRSGWNCTLIPADCEPCSCTPTWVTPRWQNAVNPDCL